MFIGKNKIGENERPFIIAEMSCNHLGKLENALKIIEVAKESGADAIKFQTYKADTITIAHDSSEFQIKKGLWKGKSLYELYSKAYTPWEWHKELFDKAREVDLIAFSSPFDPTSIDFLEELNCPAYKIASFEAVDIPLITKAASTGKPLIISTGMANEVEINDAVLAARSAGCKDLAVLHCVSGYPTPIEDSNLATIQDLKKRYNVVVGLSDHTQGFTSVIVGVALGANIIEKHLILNRDNGGFDADFSLEPNEFKRLVDESNRAWESLGNVDYSRKKSETENLVFRRSLYIVADISENEEFTPDNVKSIRPGFGLPPKHLNDIYGKKANRDIPRGTALKWEFIKK